MKLSEICPTRSEYVAIVRDAAYGSGLAPAIKRKLTLHAKEAPNAVYGIDFWSGSACPLRVVGVTRSWHGAWEVPGARAFQLAYDKAMYERVRLPGPCLVGIQADETTRPASSSLQSPMEDS